MAPSLSEGSSDNNSSHRSSKSAPFVEFNSGIHGSSICGWLGAFLDDIWMDDGIDMAEVVTAVAGPS